MPLKIENAPKARKRVEVPILSHFAGSLETSFAPMNTAAPVSSAKAESIPISTGIGEDCAANVMVKIWVLSPSSMSAMSEKLAINGMLLRFGLRENFVALFLAQERDYPKHDENDS